MQVCSEMLQTGIQYSPVDVQFTGDRANDFKHKHILLNNIITRIFECCTNAPDFISLCAL